MKMKTHLTALAILTLASMAAAQGKRAANGYAASHFFLDLDGSPAGELHGTEGGSVSAPIIEEVSDQDGFTRKHIGAPVFQEFNLQLGVNMPKSIRAWIESTMNKDYQRKSGSIITADFNRDKRRAYEFHDALLTEITFPRCESASTDPGYIDIRLAPEHARNTKATGKAAGGNPTSKRSQFQSRNFRLKIDGLDCTRVVKIESLTVKSRLATRNVGESRDYFKEPGKIEFPNLKVTFSAESIESWQTWLEDFVLAGKNGQEYEKSGVLEFLAPDLKTTLLKLEFTGLGIFRLEQEKQSGSNESFAYYTAELYCEKMVMSPGTVE